MPDLTWEEAVCWLRDQPDQADLVKACYFDDPVIEAAERFAQSDEWRTLTGFLPAVGHALDLGAGRGMASYALAKAGWSVTALESDSSEVVGAGAIRRLARDSGLKIDVIEESFERQPFSDGLFDVVYARQALHHARNLNRLCQEVLRVLKPGGRFIATREHVISCPEDLPSFLDAHPLHHLYGGENAYLLDEYLAAIRGAGLEIRHLWGPYDSVINYFPAGRPDMVALARKKVETRIGSTIARLILRDEYPPGKWLVDRVLKLAGRRDNTPGRLFSFLAEKPVSKD